MVKFSPPSSTFIVVYVLCGVERERERERESGKQTDKTKDTIDKDSDVKTETANRQTEI
jgi:hypothetical protein